MKKLYSVGKLRQPKRLALAVCLAFLASVARFASHDAQASADDFEQKVAPIFAANCLGCHGAKIQRGQLDLRTEAAVLKGGSRGAAVASPLRRDGRQGA